MVVEMIAFKTYQVIFLTLGSTVVFYLQSNLTSFSHSHEQNTTNIHCSNCYFSYSQQMHSCDHFPFSFPLSHLISTFFSLFLSSQEILLLSSLPTETRLFSLAHRKLVFLVSSFILLFFPTFCVF